MSSLTIISPGLYTTVQDQGRSGFAHLGVPESGAMDKQAAGMANAILNNPQEAAVIECTLIGPQIQWDSDAFFVLTGAIIRATLNEREIPMGETIFAKAGSILLLKEVKNGCRTYIGVAGGILSQKVLGSRSMYAPLTGFSLQKGDQLEIGPTDFTLNKGAKLRPPLVTLANFKKVLSIQAYEGPEYGMLNNEQRDFLRNTFTVSSNWNRMALQLEERLENNLRSMLTSAVAPGTVQLTPSGQLIILLNDCQTTGGYPRVLQLSKASISKIAQLKQGDSLLLDKLSSAVF